MRDLGDPAFISMDVEMFDKLVYFDRDWTGPDWTGLQRTESRIAGTLMSVTLVCAAPVQMCYLSCQ